MIVELLKALDDDLSHLRPITVLKSSAIDEVPLQLSQTPHKLTVIVHRSWIISPVAIITSS